MESTVTCLSLSNPPLDGIRSIVRMMNIVEALFHFRWFEGAKLLEIGSWQLDTYQFGNKNIYICFFYRRERLHRSIDFKDINFMDFMGILRPQGPCVWAPFAEQS